MDQIELIARTDEGVVTRKMPASHGLSHYRKHCRWVADSNAILYPDARAACHMLDVAQRCIRFMDVMGLVGSRWSQPLAGLLGRRSLPGFPRWGSVPGCYGFDHTMAWRRPGDRHPCLITTEPYGISPEVRANMDVLCEQFGLAYTIGTKGEGLWNPPYTWFVQWRAASAPGLRGRAAEHQHDQPDHSDQHQHADRRQAAQIKSGSFLDVAPCGQRSRGFFLGKYSHSTI